MRRLGRAWGTSIVAWLAVVALGAAIAVASEGGDEPVDPAPVEDVVDADTVVDEVEVTEVETEAEAEAEDTDAVSGEKTQNHGRCVSYWTHEAKSQGLEGKRKGAFVSTIAQDPEAIGDGGTATCDFQADLDAALADQAAAEAEETEEAAEDTGDDEGTEGTDGSEATSDSTTSDAGDGDAVDDGKGGGKDKARRWKGGV